MHQLSLYFGKIDGAANSAGKQLRGQFLVSRLAIDERENRRSIEYDLIHSWLPRGVRQAVH
jgi:hypothetical protein